MTDRIEKAVKAILMNSVGEALDVEVEYGVHQVELAVDAREDELAALREERDKLQELFREVKWIEFDNDMAWQRVLGGWNVYERDGEEWNFVEQISDKAALGQEDAGA